MIKHYGKDYFGDPITEIKEVLPPDLCVPWFHEHFSVGDKISFGHDGGLGGSTFKEGTITKMENAELYVNGKSYLMGYLFKVSKIA